ncbi:MAG: arsinothricin resistance N-acetyltransferase ArsN1 family B [Pseudomonadota bacterium]
MIRNATVEDATGILAIYKPIVLETSISFETEVPSIDEIQKRIASNLASHAYLVAVDEGQIAGYAYGGSFRPRKAYDKSVEVTVYVSAKHQKKGIGRQLYSTLLPELAAKGFHSALAGICLPNQPSVAIHQEFGFSQIGVFREVGYKFGRWHDVEWWQKSLERE